MKAQSDRTETRHDLTDSQSRVGFLKEWRKCLHYEQDALVVGGEGYRQLI